MPSLNEMEQMLAGLDSRKKELTDHKMALVRLSGMEEQVEINKKSMAEIDEKKVEADQDLKDLKETKNIVLEDVTSRVEEAINRNLPVFKSKIWIDEKGELQIFCEMPFQGDQILVRYDALSGGEKVLFDKALGVALSGGMKNVVVITEAAELDDDNIDVLLADINEVPPGQQHIVLSCHLTGLSAVQLENIQFVDMGKIHDG